LVEQCGGLLKAVGIDSPGCQFDHERHAVKFSAYICNNGRFQIADAQMSATCDRTFHEQLRRRELLHSRRSQSSAVRRIRQRIQAVHVLTLNPKRLAAGREDMDLRRALYDACRQRGYRFYEMFAGIENKKNALIAQVGNQAWCRVVRLNGQPLH